MPSNDSLKSMNGPVTSKPSGSLTLRGLPPTTSICLQTSFFIASSSFTQGPPVSLQPGELAMVISMSRLSAKLMAYLKASFHSGVM